MPTALQSWRRAVEATITALTPESDGSALAYRFVDTLDEERGDGQHRELCWAIPGEHRTMLEESDEKRWLATLELFIHRDPEKVVRTFRAHHEAAENEANAIETALNGMTVLGRTAGGAADPDVLEMIVERVTYEPSLPARRPPASGGIQRSRVIKVVFHFQVDTQEA